MESSSLTIPLTDNQSFIVPLDAFDVKSLLDLRTKDLRLPEKPGLKNYDRAPIWRKKPEMDAEEYYEFEIKSLSNEPCEMQKGCSKTFENTDHCYICDIAIPPGYMQSHCQGVKHSTCAAILSHALHRTNQHMTQSVSLPHTNNNTAKTQPVLVMKEETYYCDQCCAVVNVENKDEHEITKEHKKAVAYDRQLKNFLALFVDKVVMENCYCNDVNRENKDNSDTLNEQKETISENDNRVENYCNICNNIFENNVRLHYESETHKKSLDQTFKHYLMAVKKQNNTCKVCKVKVPNNIQNIQDHIEGRNHINTYNFILNLNRIKKVNGGFYCEICKKAVEETLEVDHIDTGSHVINKKNQDKTVANKKDSKKKEPAVVKKDPNANDRKKNADKVNSVNNYYCNVCEVGVPNHPHNIKEHTSGLRHKASMVKILKNGQNHGLGTKNTVQGASNSMISLTKTNMYSVLDNVQNICANKDTMSPSYHSKGASIERSTFNSRGDYSSGSGSRSGPMGVGCSSSDNRCAGAPAAASPANIKWQESGLQLKDWMSEDQVTKWLEAAAAPVRQEPLPEDKKKAVKWLIIDHLVNPDEETMVADFNHQFPPQYHADVVTEILNIALEKASKEVAMIAKSLLHLVSTNTISADNFLAGLKEILEFAPDLHIDIPMLYDFLGMLIAPHVEKKHVTFVQISMICDTIVSSNHGQLLLKAVIKELHDSMEPFFVKIKWQESGLQLKDWMSEDQVAKWLEAAAAPVRQEPLPEDKKKAVKWLIIDHLVNPDEETMVADFNRLFPPQYHADVVTEILNVALQKASKEVAMIAKSLLHLVSTNTISADNFLAGLKEILEFAPDLHIDIPMLYDFLGMLIAPHVEKKHITFVQIFMICDTIISSNHGQLLLKVVIKELNDSMGPSFVNSKWQESGLQLKDWMSEDQVAKWLEAAAAPRK